MIATFFPFLATTTNMVDEHEFLKVLSPDLDLRTVTD